MKHLSNVRTWSALALAAILCAPAAAQETKQGQEQKPEPIRLEPPGMGEDDPHQEIERLFGEVERKMMRVNRLLQEASAGKRKANASGELQETIDTIEKLLQQTTDSSRSAVEDIDKILELASHPHSGGQCNGKTGGLCKGEGQGSSPSGKPSSKPGGKQAKGSKPGQSDGSQGSQPSPLDRQGTATAQRESTPQGPEQGGKKDGKQPGQSPGGEKPGDQQESHDGNPRGNKDSQGLAQNTPGANPPGNARDVVGVQPSAQDRWGDLPELPREIFRMQGSGDMPARYRDWIDAYYRRLNQKP